MFSSTYTRTVQVIRMWNSLQIDLRRAKSSPNFKSMLRQNAPPFKNKSRCRGKVAFCDISLYFLIAKSQKAESNNFNIFNYYQDSSFTETPIKPNIFKCLIKNLHLKLSNTNQSLEKVCYDQKEQKTLVAAERGEKFANQASCSNTFVTCIVNLVLPPATKLKLVRCKRKFVSLSGLSLFLVIRTQLEVQVAFQQTFCGHVIWLGFKTF